ncbi:MAG: tetratricopeptide repeat protein [Pseudomonadota bacterium]
MRWFLPAAWTAALVAAPLPATAGPDNTANQPRGDRAGRADGHAAGDDMSNTPRGGGRWDARDIARIRSRADQGEAQAMYDLGMAYREGEGVERDLAQAVVWLRKAAQRGLPEAMNDLGYAYSRGEGVARDYAEALAWYRKAADKGDIIAMLNIGVAYDLGQGVAIDDREAVKWYRRSAEGGDPTAALYLAGMYEDAEGVARDFEEAARWYARAAESNDPEERQEALDGLDRVGEGRLPMPVPAAPTDLIVT